jgi:hypothetical protein
MQLRLGKYNQSPVNLNFEVRTARAFATEYFPQAGNDRSVCIGANCRSNANFMWESLGIGQDVDLPSKSRSNCPLRVLRHIHEPETSRVVTIHTRGREAYFCGT